MKRIIGVTGGIASGKSHVCSVIESMGYPVIDADEIAMVLSQKGNKGYDAIIKAFGEEYLTEDQQLNRQKLGKLIFKNSAARTLLNQVTHPMIIEEIKHRISLISDGLVFLEAPLLYESKLSYLCDKIICVFLPKKLQVERLMVRDGIDEDYALTKIHSQMDLYEKKVLADIVIDSSGTLDQTEQFVQNEIRKLEGETYGSSHSNQ